jgi:peptide/nickel transport system ATP-binding protein
MLDAVTQVQIWDLITNIVREHNIGMLVVSHDKELVKRVCDDVVDLSDINNS